MDEKEALNINMRYYHHDLYVWRVVKLAWAGAYINTGATRGTKHTEYRCRDATIITVSLSLEKFMKGDPPRLAPCLCSLSAVNRDDPTGGTTANTLTLCYAEKRDGKLLLLHNSVKDWEIVSYSTNQGQETK